MDGAQTGTETSGLGPKADNLDVVLGRFQNWAKAQRIKPGKAAAQATKLPAEVREISYEQALRASSYRRPAHPPTDTTYVGPLPPEIKTDPNPKATSPVAQPLIVNVPEDNSSPVATIPGTPQKEDSEYLNQRGPEFRFTAAAQAIAQDAATPNSVSEASPLAASPTHAQRQTTAQGSKSPAADPAQAETQAVQTKSAKPAPSSAKKPHPAKRPVQKSRKAGSQAKAAKSVVPGVAGIAAKPNEINARQTAPEAHDHQPSESNFPEALKNAITVGTPKPTPSTPVLNITVERGPVNSLTLRISDQEKTRLETGAARANLALSDYLLQCALGAEQTPTHDRIAQTDLSESIYLRQYALGVDELRGQMKLALSRLNRQHPQNTLPPPAKRKLSALPAILAGFAIHSLRRLRRNSTEPPSVIPR